MKDCTIKHIPFTDLSNIYLTPTFRIAIETLMSIVNFFPTNNLLGNQTECHIVTHRFCDDIARTNNKYFFEMRDILL